MRSRILDTSISQHPCIINFDAVLELSSGQRRKSVRKVGSAGVLVDELQTLQNASTRAPTRAAAASIRMMVLYGISQLRPNRSASEMNNPYRM